MSTCAICLVYEAASEEAIRLHYASAHYGTYVCLLCDVANYPGTINGIRAHYLRLHKKEYLDNKNFWENKFAVMRCNLKNQVAQNQAAQNQAAPENQAA